MPTGAAIIHKPIHNALVKSWQQQGAATKPETPQQKQNHTARWKHKAIHMQQYMKAEQNPVEVHGAWMGCLVTNINYIGLHTIAEVAERTLDNEVAVMHSIQSVTLYVVS